MALGRRTKTAAPTKGSKKVAPKKTGPSRRERLRQIKQAFTLTRERDPKLVPLLAGTFLLVLAVFVLIGVFLGPLYLFIVLGVIAALLATVSVFGRRLQRTGFNEIEGQLGAGAAVLQRMRGDWRVTPAVGFTKEQDLVHRVIGRPGIVLVAEGSLNRTRSLMGAEKKRLARIVGETPVYEVFVGEDGPPQVSIRELEKHFAKLPRNIKPAQVNVLDARMKALGSTALPVPKGPMPTRMPRGKGR